MENRDKHTLHVEWYKIYITECSTTNTPVEREFSWDNLNHIRSRLLIKQQRCPSNFWDNLNETIKDIIRYSFQTSVMYLGLYNER